MAPWNRARRLQRRVRVSRERCYRMCRDSFPIQQNRHFRSLREKAVTAPLDVRCQSRLGEPRSVTKPHTHLTKPVSMGLCA